MILKKADDRAPDLATLNALLDRPDLTRRKRDGISQQIDRMHTGDLGEREVAFHLNHHLRDNPNIHVIHDLRLEVDGQVAQIDHLVVSRFRLAYVLETKSLNASLQCNEAGEWTAWYGAYKRGVPQPIPSPIEQARRHVDILQRWLKAKGWTTIKRVEPVVVVSPTTFVGKTRAKGDEAVAIVRSDLFKRWWEHDRDIGNVIEPLWLMASRYSTEQLAELGALLVAGHRPARRDWAAQFGLKGLGDAPGRTRQSTPAPVEITADLSGALSTPVAGATRRGATTFRQVATPCGSVHLRPIGDGRYAIRHEHDDRLTEYVRHVGSRYGEWQPRYKNWLVPAHELDTVVAELSGSIGPT